jgi:hypothetical protein
MSTYLLLRNNKESGPFTIEEIKRMSLKSYDLVWIEGKSALWRYPGEISEFTSFAPPVPEQPFDRFYKKAVPESNTSATKEIKKEIVANQPPGVIPNRESVYINLPASEKKLTGFVPDAPVRDPDELSWNEPVKYSNGYDIAARPSRSAGKGLLIGSIMLMFGAGLFTGYFISNRRNFYSTHGISPQLKTAPVKSLNLPQRNTEQSGFFTATDGNKKQSSQESALLTGSNTPSIAKSKKKSGIISFARKDSLHTAAVRAPVIKVSDSAGNRQESENKANALAAKIKAHPGEYLLITPGKYKVGVLGGISEVPISLINRSGVTMDLVVVAVDYVLRNKKIFKTENVSFRNLAPGTTVSDEAPKSPRGVNITYRLTIANSQQIGMSYSNL